MMEGGVLLKANEITRIYHRGSEEIRALDAVSVEVRGGEFVTFTGPSGSGKTTLLHMLGCLDNPTSGELELDGHKIFGGGKILGERKLTGIRRKTFGYIFQNFYLLPTLTVLENVLLPLTFFRKSKAGEDAKELLAMLGIAHRMRHLPEQISGGEMQRVAIARALVNHPEILLADEPTGNLDSRRTEEIGEVLKNLNRDLGLTILLVTHNPSLAALGGRIIHMSDGRIHAETPN